MSVLARIESKCGLQTRKTLLAVDQVTSENWCDPLLAERLWFGIKIPDLGSPQIEAADRKAPE